MTRLVLAALLLALAALAAEGVEAGWEARVAWERDHVEGFTCEPIERRNP